MSRPHVVSPAELSALRDLELFARTTVEGLRQGLHRSPFHGYAAEFSQYRHYRPGDDLKYVDWKAFARTDRLYSRQFRETTNLGALIVLDASGSMAFPPSDKRAGAGSVSKFELGRAAAAALGALVIDQGDAAGMLAVVDEGTGGARYVPARSGRHHLHVYLAALSRLSPAGTTGVAAALRRAATLMRRRGLIIVISDFYEEETALIEMRRLSRMGHDLIAIQVMAPEEVALPASGVVEFEDLETGATRVTSVAGVAAAYASSVADFQVRVRRAVERDGMGYLRLMAGEALEPALRRFLVGRRRSG